MQEQMRSLELAMEEIARLRKQRDEARKACEAVVVALDGSKYTPDPSKPNYRNPALVATDRGVSEAAVRKVVASYANEQESPCKQ